MGLLGLIGAPDVTRYQHADCRRSVCKAAGQRVTKDENDDITGRGRA